MGDARIPRTWGNVRKRTDADLIQRCIDNVVRSKRPWQHQLACYRALYPYTTPTIAMMTAQAARRVGEAIAKAAKP